MLVSTSGIVKKVLQLKKKKAREEKLIKNFDWSAVLKISHLPQIKKKRLLLGGEKEKGRQKGRTRHAHKEVQRDKEESSVQGGSPISFKVHKESHQKDPRALSYKGYVTAPEILK